MKPIYGVLLCIIIVCIAASYLIYSSLTNDQKSNISNSIKPSLTNYQQTPYIIKQYPTKVTIIPTPTPLYYEEIKYPSEPCSQTIEIFNMHCMGRVKDESYCAHWEYEMRKNCKFIQW